MAELYREAPAAATLSPNKKHCYACANILDVRAEICPQCGVRQPVLSGAMMVLGPTAMTVTSKNRQTAGIFALLLGGIGVHKFYLGQPGMGVLYLVFCWTAIPALIGFIEGIVLLTMTDQAFAEKFPG
ncbi:MAG: TM2 domain-containing protein [Kofleriaceae bacterium]|nr:TM2 domain-containing protein [Kofleriaceae bacterium]